MNRLTAYTISRDGMVPGFPLKREYTYEGYNRKTERILEEGSEVEQKTYTYDQTHWLTSITGQVSGRDSYAIDYTYDANGNTLSKVDSRAPADRQDFLYSADDRLVRVTRGPPGSEEVLGLFDYNHEGNRVRHRLSDRGDVDYFYDDGSVLEEHNANDDSLLAYYVYADRLIALAQPAPKGKQYYHHDALGSTIGLTDATGNDAKSYRLDPWGNIRAQSGISDNRRIFTGHEHDLRTGLVYFGARFYDPETARFITQDTYLGESNTPPSLHRYLYAYSNPTVYTDPFGFSVWRQWLNTFDSWRDDRNRGYNLEENILRNVAGDSRVSPGKSAAIMLAMSQRNIGRGFVEAGLGLCSMFLHLADFVADDRMGMLGENPDVVAVDRIITSVRINLQERVLQNQSVWKALQEYKDEFETGVAKNLGQGLKDVFIEGRGESQREFFGMTTGFIVPYAAGKAVGYGVRLAVGVSKNWSSVRAGVARAGEMLRDMAKKLPGEVRGSSSSRKVPNAGKEGLQPAPKGMPPLAAEPKLLGTGVSDARMWQVGKHFEKHGRMMGFESKQQYDSAAKIFARKYGNHPDAQVFEGVWGGKGQLAGSTQRVIVYRGRSVILDTRTGQVIDFYLGAEHRGLIDLQRVR
jgi:RHS repeat-associated protein